MAKKELFFFLVDVGPSMERYKEDLSRMLFTFAETRLINKAAHEMTLLLFGSTETNNAVNKEYELAGSPGDYMNISVMRDLCCTDFDFLRELKDVGLPRRQTGKSDVVEALLVALDMIGKVMAPPANNKTPITLVLVSDLLQESIMDPDTQDHVVGIMQEHNVNLEVISMDVADHISATEQAQAAKGSNLRMLEQLVTEVKGRISTPRRYVTDPVECLGLFKTKEVAPTATYCEFTIGTTVKIRTRVYKKASGETPPSLKTHYREMVRLEGEAGGAVGDKELYRPSFPDDPVPTEEMVTGYRYGKEPIPINALLEADIKYQLDKCFELVGFVDSSTIPRYHLVGDPSLVLAVLEEGSQKGLSALVRAMERGNKAAVARIVQRANSAVKLVLLTPNLGTLTIPDSMIMSTLPLAEDIRTFTFPPLTKNLPTAQQASAADELVRSLDLTQSSSGREMLQPETTFNPHLQHWYYQLGVKALNPNADLARDTRLDRMYMDPPLKDMPAGAASALRALPGLFQVKEIMRREWRAERGALDNGGGAEGGDDAEARKKARTNFDLLDGDEDVGPSCSDITDDVPLEDFANMLRAGNVDDAITAMELKIKSFVDNSVMSRSYPKALSCLVALRKACVSHLYANAYNDFLEELLIRYKAHAAHSDFVVNMVAEGQPGSTSEPQVLLPIHKEEVPSSITSKSEAEAFVATNSVFSGPEVVQAAAVDLTAEDDFDDME